jgi:FixJ family two-component response regulator
MRILLAEDDTSLRTALGRLLRAAGHDGEGFESGEALLQSGRSEAADCVVTDIHLPGMSGLELADTLREHYRLLPVIFITAFDSPALKEQALQRRGAAYLVKPFEGTALLEAIRKATLFRA